MKIRITASKSKAISTLCASTFEVFLASIVIPIFVGGFDSSEIPVLIFGLIATTSFGYLSVLFAERGKL